ncbi:MAG: LPS-assembly protein LptD [Lentisphaeria bacterium]|nr:LPS-assembly protein LptD [Lentisphaeria bacterium]
MRPSVNLKVLLILLCGVSGGLFSLYGRSIGGSGGLSGVNDPAEGLALPRFNELRREDVDMSADTYEYVGSNLIARGHAVIRSKNLQITANAITINLISKDVEAAGNVVFSTQVIRNTTLTPTEYEKLLEHPSVKVIVTGITTSPDGTQKIKASLVYNGAYLSAERASGSLETGALQFRNFFIKAGYIYFRGHLAERYPNGKVKMFNSRMTTCEYEMDSNAHYGIESSVMTLTPREANRSIYNYNPDQGEHSLLMMSNFINVWNVPVFWLPALYKPADSNSFGIRFEFGSSSDWGYYLRTSKEFDIIDEPAVIRAGLIVDYYSDRGFGLGSTVDVLTKNSKTEFFAYYIHDRNPYLFWNEDRGKVETGYTSSEWFSRFGRYELPSDRYEFRLSNLTHLTPRLDFRGTVDLLSDFNFLEDYFENRYERNVQPPSYAAAEYQGENFSATLQTTFRVNDFFTTIERLPELRLDIFRQELFKNIYYQGETSAGYYRSRWRKYDFSRSENPSLDIYQLLVNEQQTRLWRDIRRRYGPNNRIGAAKFLRQVDRETFAGYFDDPEDYESFRFDTLHGLYYPFQLFGFLNLIPRVMARFTAYSDSSKKKIDVDGLYSMYAVDQKYRWPNYQIKVQNYDDKGGARYRLAFEFGLEGNVKLSRAWQTPRSAFWQIDGLRHVAVPYFNLTYVPKPTEDYRHIYYFDEVDQIEEDAFIRLGIQNRLQTRRNNQLYTWLSMENYWDFHFISKNGFNHIGDLGTILTFSPTSRLSFSTQLLLDVGGNGDHDYRVWRGDKDAGRPGLNWDLINQFNVRMRYKIAEDWIFNIRYVYSDFYQQRTMYSMGSTLSQINATTQFNSYVSRNQYVGGSLSFPTFDKRLKGTIFATYDIDDDLVDEMGITFRRDFHCWFLAVTAGISSDRDYSERKKSYRKEWDPFVSVTVGISAMPGLAYTARYERQYYE